MENNSGKGIFYGVIGIATLIVAIVGATFAYFTATAQSEEGAINVTSYSGFSVSLSINEIVSVDKLIPLDSAQYLASALSHKGEGDIAEPCIDVNGDQVCAIYEMELTNNGSSEVDVVGYLSADVNNYETNNLKYQIYNCTDGADEDTKADTFTAITGSGAVDAPKKGVDATTLPKFIVGENGNNIIKIAGKQEGMAAPTAKLCLVMWLEDTKTEQNMDQNRTFAGKVTFNATTGNGETLEAKFN